MRPLAPPPAAINETRDRAAPEHRSYPYDSLNRLTEMRLGSPSGPLQAVYTYDAAPALGGRLGNMTAKQEGASATPAAMTFNAEHVHAPSSYNGGPLLYDKNGNLLYSMWVEGFLYNVENQRAQATNYWYGLVTNYLYDGDGNLVRRDSTLPGFEAYKHTEVEELYQEDSVGCATTPTSTTRFYRAFGRIIATRTTTSSASDVRYYVADHLGSTNTILTASGSVYAGGMKYWPFGAQRSGGTPDHGYTGQLRDDYSTIGAYYYHARFYSTTLARFTQPDSHTGDGLNRYAYARQSPLRYSDPTGHCVLGRQRCSSDEFLNFVRCAVGGSCNVPSRDVPGGDWARFSEWAVLQQEFWSHFNTLQLDAPGRDFFFSVGLAAISGGISFAKLDRLPPMGWAAIGSGYGVSGRFMYYSLYDLAHGTTYSSFLGNLDIAGASPWWWLVPAGQWSNWRLAIGPGAFDATEFDLYLSFQARTETLYVDLQTAWGTSIARLNQWWSNWQWSYLQDRGYEVEPRSFPPDACGGFCPSRLPWVPFDPWFWRN